MRNDLIAPEGIFRQGWLVGPTLSSKLPNCCFTVLSMCMVIRKPCYNSHVLCFLDSHTFCFFDLRVVCFFLDLHVVCIFDRHVVVCFFFADGLSVRTVVERLLQRDIPDQIGETSGVQFELTG